jgi:Ser/Thr protein kinase RdoA (MazF antagonist)
LRSFLVVGFLFVGFSKMVATYLPKCLELFGLATKAKQIDSREDEVYEVESGNKLYILRIRKRVTDYNTVLAETHWVSHLEANGIPVHKQIRSTMGNFVEHINVEGVDCLLTVTEKAEGGWTIGSREKFWSKELWVTMGRTLGKMHTLSSAYSPLPHAKRKNFADEDFLDPSPLLKDDSPQSKAILTKRDQLITWMKSLPTDLHSYGLIHNDFNRGNFFVDDNGKMTLFDFDDCCYAWYALDFASTVYYAIGDSSKGVYLDPMPKEDMEKFLDAFITGYKEEAGGLMETAKWNWIDPVIVERFYQVRALFLLLNLMRKGQVNDTPNWNYSKWINTTRERLAKTETI